MFNIFVASGIILLQFFILIIIYSLIKKNTFIKELSKYTHVLLLVVFTSSVLGSLIYEYYFGYPPCLLCWYQRIAIFPIAIFSIIGDIRKNIFLNKIVMIFSSLGLIVAIFHNIIDIFPTGIDICGSTGPSCLARYIYEFGYITIPMMSLTVLLFGFLISLTSKVYPQTSIANMEK